MIVKLNSDKGQRSGRQNIKTLMRRRYKKTFGVVMILFLLTSAMVMTCLVVMQENQTQLERNFTGNINTHIINVRAGLENNRDEGMNFEDHKRIAEQLRGMDGKYKLLHVYDFGFGIQDHQGRTWFLHGLNRAAQQILGLTIREGEAIGTARKKTEEILLDVPVIEEKEGGFESSREEVMPLTVRAVGDDASPLALLRSGERSLYVNEKTYARLLSLAYGMDEDQFGETESAGSGKAAAELGDNGLKEIFVYCSSMHMVEPAAKKLRTAGYDVSYTLQAFDNMSSTIGKSARMLLIVAVVAYLAAALILLAGFYTNFRHLQKDMGMLRHMGFSPGQVRSFFSGRITGTAAASALFDAVFAAAASFFLAREVFLSVYVFTMLLMLVSLLVILAMSHGMLFWYSRRDVLTLLKYSRESE